MRFLPQEDIVPVLMFHSVGMSEPGWVWQQLSERADAFEGFLKLLAARGYRTITLAELHDHMSGVRPCEPRSVGLAFDDGYLDNWVTVYPLLKKYGMRGTVHVNPDFVDPGNELRPRLDESSGDGADSAALDQTGFMNWAELEQVDQSGVLDVQSHSLTHTWYFTGPSIVDFYTPTSAVQYPWLAWNARPDRKPFYIQEDQTGFVPWGMPIFEHEKSLIARRFFPDSSCMDRVIDAFANEGGPERFAGDGRPEKLQELVQKVTGSPTFPGTYESEGDYETRVRGELSQSKAIIEQKLGKSVDYLCCPGGGSNAAVKRIALEVGYKSWNLSSREQREKRNRPGVDPREVRRMPSGRGVMFFGRHWGVGTEKLLFLEILTHKGSWFFDVLRKCYKLGVAAGFFGVSPQR